MIKDQQLINYEDYPILEGRYALIKKIGSGVTCSVKLAKDIQSDNFYAVKLLKTKGGKNSMTQNEKVFRSEMENLKKIQHKNIIGIVEGGRGVIKKPCGTNKLKDFIVLEIASNGELFDFLFFPKKGFGEYYGRYLFTELINGLEACHSAGVAHRDLKTENIMVNENWILKLADFGYSTLLKGTSGNGVLTTPLGTLSYAAPEILSKKPYQGSSADLFSCGVILFVLVTGKLPFGKALVYDNYYRNFVRSDYEGFWSLMGPKIDPVSDEFKSILNSILAYDPSQRPNIEDIKNHAWMKKSMPDYQEILEEFEKRKVIVKNMRELEAQQQQQEKKNRQVKIVKTGGYKGDCDEANFEEQPERILNDWVESSNPCKFKIKGSQVDDVLNKLYEYFSKVDTREKKIDVSMNSYKLNIEYEIEKEVKELDLDVEKLELEISISQANNDLVVEFLKKNGEKFEFYDIFENFLSFDQSVNI